MDRKRVREKEGARKKSKRPAACVTDVVKDDTRK